jgi:ribosomal protein L16 Arg81 hydroxylase
MYETFSSLLYPVTVKEFADNYHCRRSLLVKNQPDKFKGLYSWELFNQMLGTSIITNIALLPFTKYISPELSFGFISGCAEGHALKLGTTEWYSTELKEYIDRLANELKAYLTVNLYASTPEKMVSPIHYDKYDLLVLQIDGQKRWQITEPVKAKDTNNNFRVKTEPFFAEEWDKWEKDQLNDTIVHPGDDFPENKLPYLDIIMEPGDVLYIPQGHWHKVVPVENVPALHLTIAMSYFNRGMDFFLWFKNKFNQEPLFKNFLPLFPKTQKDNLFKLWDNHVKEMAEFLNEKLQNKFLLTEYNEKFLGERSATETFNFPLPYHKDILSPNKTGLFSKNFLQYILDYREDGTILIVVNGQEITIEKDMETFIKYIFSKDSFTIENILTQITDLPQNKILLTLNMLVKNNIIKILDL